MAGGTLLSNEVASAASWETLKSQEVKHYLAKQALGRCIPAEHSCCVEPDNVIAMTLTPRGKRRRTMLIPCPECRHRISQHAPNCPKCGRPISREEASRAVEAQKKQQTGCAIAAGGFLLLVTLAFRGCPTGSVQPPRATLPATMSTPAPLADSKPVTVSSREVVFCGFCGRKISESRKELRALPAEASRLSMVRKYSVCSAPRCHKAAALRTKHPQWDQETCYCIAGRLVRLGMTKEQAKAAWGAPRDINRTVTAFGVSEQWCYGELGGSYLYFEDDRLVSIQN